MQSAGGLIQQSSSVIVVRYQYVVAANGKCSN
jgi:hypothetical protein